MEAPPPPWYPAWRGECIPDKTTPPIEGATPAAVRTSSSSRMVLAPPVSRAMHHREVVAGIPSWPCDCGLTLPSEYLMVYQTHCHGNAVNCCLPARAMYCHWQSEPSWGQPSKCFYGSLCPLLVSHLHAVQLFTGLCDVLDTLAFCKTRNFWMLETIVSGSWKGSCYKMIEFHHGHFCNFLAVKMAIAKSLMRQNLCFFQ